MAAGWTIADEATDSELKARYEAHDWTGLAQVLAARPGPELYQGAVAAVFNDAHAEAVLWSAIHASPHSEAAYEGYEWLSHLYVRNGQYRQLDEAMEKRWAAFPGRRGENDAMAPLRGLPDQSGAATGATTLHHDGSIFLPASIEGGTARYFFDTGALLSCMSESEAKRLGLTIREAEGSLGTSTGARVGLRTAVARDVTIGGTRFENVSFAIFPDDQEPWSVLPPGQRGILGIPLLLGLRSLRWSPDGTVVLGLKPGALDVRKANLFFDNDHLVTAVRFRNERIMMTLDTGAETTDLYEGFGVRFASVLEKSGRKGSREVRGVGHSESFDSITVPEVRLEVGGLGTTLRPAHVLMKSIGAKPSVGNVGLDLLKQARAFRIDFGAMTLQLEPNR